MPKVKQVTARKDYPDHGIKKGQAHFTWSLMTGPRSSRTFRQIEPPRPSQLTTSEFKGNLFAIEEDLANATQDEGLPDTIQEFADNLRTLGEEQNEKFENMPEGLQQGSTGELLEGRATSCEEYADSLGEIADALRDKIEEINGKEWSELDEFDTLDPEEDEVPSEDEIESARQGEITTACQEALEEAGQVSPGFD